jgi:hypothetical protein
MTCMIKIVPRADPNAEGKWIEVEIDRDELPRGWAANVECFRSQVPDDHVMVAIDRGAP